ncbi:MAG: uracil-DNA glycosylase, partial [Pacificimonas sp.]
LDKMLAAIGLDRTSAYITNLSPWRPGANRTPSTEEAAELLPLLHRHIAIAKPRLILAVGGASAKALLDTEKGIMSTRGAWRDVIIEETSISVLPTFHPAYLLRQPGQKRLAWRDLLALKDRLDARRA